MPGIQSLTEYDIRHFFPERTHGSILIRTRSSRLTFAKQFRLLQIEDVHQSLATLVSRSGRDTEGDADAHKLASRLDGLPLALTTAGVYLSQTTDSFGDYLQMYEDSWDDLAENSSKLLKYADRTLYPTWNLSLRQIEVQALEAANLLRLMAYLSNLDLWYDLFQKGADFGTAWFSNVVKSKARFNRAMAKLQEYSLIEVRARSYSFHTCVLDWTLESLNRDFDAELCRLAIHCVANSVKFDDEAEFWSTDRRLSQHVNRLEYGRLKESIDWENVNVDDIYHVGRLYGFLQQWAVAEKWYHRALRSSEKQYGAEHQSSFRVLNALGITYWKLGKLAKVDTMHRRTLRGYEKIGHVEESIINLDIAINLGILYQDQGKLAEAETIYKDALEEKGKVAGC